MPYLLRGGPDGLAKPELLRDRDGGLMHTGRYWDPVSRAHTSGAGPGVRAYSALPFDWDGDGDLDLVVGTDRGDLFLRVNAGTATEPAFATGAATIRAGAEPAVVPGGYAMPVAADWDGDGRVDLVSGSKRGGVFWFRSTAAGGSMALEPPRRLTGDATGRTDQPGVSTQVAVADWDGDGDLDLLVGDRHARNTADGLERHGFVWLFRRVEPAANARPGGVR